MMLKRERTPSEKNDDVLIVQYVSTYPPKQNEFKQVGNKTQNGVERLAKCLTIVDEITLVTLRLPKLKSIVAAIEKAKLK